MRVFDAGPGWFEAVAFSPDGGRVAAVDGRQHRVAGFEVPGGPPRFVLDLRVKTPLFPPAGPQVLFFDTFRTYAVDWGSGAASELGGPTGRTADAVLTPAGRMVTVHDGHDPNDDRARVRTWAFGPDGLPAVETELVVDGPRYLGWQLWPDGSRLIRLDIRTVGVLTLPDLRVETEFADDQWRNVRVPAPDGRQWVSVDGRRLFVREGPDWAAGPRKVLNPGPKHFTGVAFHPSGRYLAATSNDTTVKLYDTGSWQLAKTFTWDVGRLRSIAFSPHGTLAAAGSDTGKVVVWDVDL